MFCVMGRAGMRSEFDVCGATVNTSKGSLNQAQARPECREPVPRRPGNSVEIKREMAAKSLISRCAKEPKHQ